MAFHSVFTLFVMLGWIWQKTRRIHLWAVLLTLFSWVVLGIWYGFGYCFLTDWHWEVLRALGTPPNSNSYVHFLILETTGLNLDPGLVDRGTVAVFIISLLLSAGMNYRDYRKE